MDSVRRNTGECVYSIVLWRHNFRWLWRSIALLDERFHGAKQNSSMLALT